MILEYNKFINIIENDNITIEILDNVIKEEFRYEKVNDEYRDKLLNIENTIEEYLAGINPFKGKYLDNEMKFEIVPTEHWYMKFFRKEIEDPYDTKGYVNPGLHEGINLIRNNIDYFTRLLFNETIKDNVYILIKTKDLSRYSTIISFKKFGQIYQVNLVSQMKGKDFISNSLKTFKLHPNGPLRQ